MYNRFHVLIPKVIAFKMMVGVGWGGLDLFKEWVQTSWTKLLVGGLTGNKLSQIK